MKCFQTPQNHLKPSGHPDLLFYILEIHPSLSTPYSTTVCSQEEQVRRPPHVYGGLARISSSHPFCNSSTSLLSIEYISSGDVLRYRNDNFLTAFVDRK